jgi:hypothetical protein
MWGGVSRERIGRLSFSSHSQRDVRAEGIRRCGSVTPLLFPGRDASFSFMQI